MLHQFGASVILNASITADMGLPGFAVYAATKAAVRSLTRTGPQIYDASRSPVDAPGDQGTVPMTAKVTRFTQFTEFVLLLYIARRKKKEY
jgi:NAD(P)-dependent dehydrogenase (short-subunit alcohol dehydrogenase family)